MPTLKLERNKVEVLEVEIEGNVYKIPLGTSLRRKELAKLQGNEESEKFFAQYIGDELWNDLTTGEQRQIATAWSNATQEACGMQPGESSASHNS